MLCEQLGQDPDPNKMPLEASAFPYEVQVAFFMFDLLSDRWDGMSGTYLGKDWVLQIFYSRHITLMCIKKMLFILLNCMKT
jgi:hypothetical protein